MPVTQRRAAIDSAMTHLDANRIAEALAITTVLVGKDSTSAQSQEAHALVLLAEASLLDASGQMISARKRRLEALQAYEAACNTSTQAGLLQLSTAQLAQMLEEHDIAITHYKLAHVQVPEDARASFFLAQMSMLQENWEEAQKWINESLLRDTREPFALLSSALIEAQLGNHEQALELASTGCKIRPNDTSLRFVQARVMRLAGNPHRAMEILAALPKALLESPMGVEELKQCAAVMEGSKE